jgi:hypothetical protein
MSFLTNQFPTFSFVPTSSSELMPNTQDAGHEGWYSLRVKRITSMGRNLLVILLVMGLLTALERNSLCMVAPGRFGCAADTPEQTVQDYGLFYHTGYAIAYVFDCIFLCVWMPLFNWWVSEVPVSRAALDGFSNVLMQINRVLFGAHIVWQAAQFLITLYLVLRFTQNHGSRSETPHTSWRERSILVASAAISVVIGSGALHILELAEMAKVKTLEYGMVVVPAQVLVGLRFASKIQLIRQQRVLAGKAATTHVETGRMDEKAGL